MILDDNQQARPRHLGARLPELRTTRALALTLALLLIGGWALALPTLTSTQMLTSVTTRVTTLARGLQVYRTDFTPHAAVPRSGVSSLASLWRWRATVPIPFWWYFTAALTIALLCLALASVYGDAARRIGRARGSPAVHPLHPLINNVALRWSPMGRQRASLGALSARWWRYNRISALVSARMHGSHANAVELWGSGTLFGPRRKLQAMRIGVCETRMNAGL